MLDELVSDLVVADLGEELWWSVEVVYSGLKTDIVFKYVLGFWFYYIVDLRSFL